MAETIRQFYTRRACSDGGVIGCPSDYAPFTEAYTCTYLSGNCTECWNQIYEGKQKRGR